MKYLITTTITLILFLSTSVLGHAQESPFDLSASEWQEDLKFLSETIHSDYSFLFQKVTKEEFDIAVAELYRDIPKMDDHEIVVGMVKLVALFGWGHTSLNVLPFGYHSPAGFRRLPVNFYHFSDGIYVQGIHKDYKEALGAKLLGIGDMKINEVLAAIRPCVAAENDQFVKAFGLQGLGIPEVLHAQDVIENLAKTKMTFEKDGKTFAMTFKYPGLRMWPATYGFIWEMEDATGPAGDGWLDVRQKDKYPLWLKHIDRHYWFEYDAATRTVYAQQNLVRNAQDESIAQFYDRMFEFIDNDKNQVDKLILDLRMNSGGNNNFNVPVIQNILRSTKINQQGKLFVVIGRRTYSACQNLVNELETYTEAIFVGEPTAENVNMYGDNRDVELPNSGLVARLSFAWWQNKAPWDTRVWTEPMLAADLSFEDYVNNIDPVMQVIHDYAGGKNPVTHLQHLFAEEKWDELYTAAKSYVHDPTYRFISFEADINDGGYQLLSAGKKEEALQLFKTNTDLYPESANAWDSYAECHLELDQIEKAIELYTKSISMDPDGFVGDNGRAMLEKIKGFEKSHGENGH